MSSPHQHVGVRIKPLSGVLGDVLGFPTGAAWLRPATHTRRMLQHPPPGAPADRGVQGVLWRRRSGVGEPRRSAPPALRRKTRSRRAGRRSAAAAAADAGLWRGCTRAARADPRTRPSSRPTACDAPTWASRSWDARSPAWHGKAICQTWEKPSTGQHRATGM